MMSFNIRFPNPADGIHYWEHRRPLVTSLVRYHEVDLLGVQEAFRRQLDEMVEDLPEFQWYGVCRTDGSIHPEPDGEFSAILYRSDRFELLDGNTFWLSETPEIPGSKGWDAALPRIVTWAKFRHRQSDVMFYHFNTHFDHIGEVARRESAKLLLQKVEESAGTYPLLITGDFNCNDSSEPYKILTESSPIHFVADAIHQSQMAHYGPLETFASNFQIAGLGGQRIDYIFIKNKVSILRHAIVSDSWGGRLPSDHLPVVVVVRL